MWNKTKMKSMQVQFEDWRKIMMYAKDNELTVWQVIKMLVEFKGL